MATLGATLSSTIYSGSTTLGQTLGTASWAAGGTLGAALSTATFAPAEYLFFDEFNGSANSPPDPTKWWASRSCSANPLLDSCWNQNNAYLDGQGHLVLRVTNGTMGKPYDGARIQTISSDWPPSTILGSVNAPVHVEALIKFAAGAGLWGGFWFTRADSTTNDFELDVQEFRGFFPTIVECHTHNWVEFGDSVDTGVNLWADYHLYWMDFYSDHVIFGVDALTSGTVSYSTYTASEMIRLSHDVGEPSGWGGVGGPPPTIPAYMLVDYVRAWRI